ncbi:aspartate ammonia-lyase, partial [Klebsiella pneumoniae]
MSEQPASRPSDNQGNEPTDQHNEVSPTVASSESADHYTSSSEAWDVPVAAPGSSSERIGVVMTSTDIITSAETHSQRAKSAQSFREETDLLGT